MYILEESLLVHYFFLLQVVPPSKRSVLNLEIDDTIFSFSFFFLASKIGNNKKFDNFEILLFIETLWETNKKLFDLYLQ